MTLLEKAIKNEYLSSFEWNLLLSPKNTMDYSFIPFNEKDIESEIGFNNVEAIIKYNDCFYMVLHGLFGRCIKQVALKQKTIEVWSFMDEK